MKKIIKKIKRQINGSIIWPIDGSIKEQQKNDRESEMEHFSDQLTDFWMHKGNFTNAERMEVAEKFIENIKDHSKNTVTETKEDLASAELLNDRAKNISFFGMLL